MASWAYELWVGKPDCHCRSLRSSARMPNVATHRSPVRGDVFLYEAALSGSTTRMPAISDSTCSRSALVLAFVGSRSHALE